MAQMDLEILQDGAKCRSVATNGCSPVRQILRRTTGKFGFATPRVLVGRS